MKVTIDRLIELTAHAVAMSIIGGLVANGTDTVSRRVTALSSSLQQMMESDLVDARSDFVRATYARAADLLNISDQAMRLSTSFLSSLAPSAHEEISSIPDSIPTEGVEEDS